MAPSDDAGAAVAGTVAAFLVHDGRVLVLRRSDETGAGRWAVIGGAPGEAPLDQAYAALRREAGLEAGDVALLQQGEPLHVYDPETHRTSRVHPFLFGIDDPSRLRLDRERVQRRWVWPGEIDQLDTEPATADALRRVFP